MISTYLNGHTATAHSADVEVTQTNLIITHGTERIVWPLESLRRLPDQSGANILVLHPLGHATARLIVTDPDIAAALRARTPNLTKTAPVKGKSRLWGWALASLASVALIVFVLVPVMADQLAEFIPVKGEKALGEATFNQIRSAMDETGLEPLPVCDGTAGLAALAKMEARLAQYAGLPYDIRVHVLDHGMVNAFALPGGQIVIFRGLIDLAQSPEEVAAVLAHEIGHVVSRDPTRDALRSAGSIGVLGLLLGDFAGGTVVLFLTNRLIDARYSQEAEAQADDFAHALLRQTGLPPQALGELFTRLQRIAGEPDPIVQHFADHPELSKRIAAAASAPAPADFVPVLDLAEWQALQTICSAPRAR